MINKTPLSTRKKALAIAIGCALSPGLLAQEQAATDTDDAIEEIIVSGVRISQSQAIDIKRNSTRVVDSIVAEDIGKLPDVTITDSLQRVTGVQITREAGEGTSLNIRGMPQVMTTLNGEQFLSPWSITGVQANYTDIPAGMISGVDVFKSQSANMLAGGISGVVDLKTLDPSALEEGFTTRIRLEGAGGEYSSRETNADGSKDWRDPDYSAGLVLGFNNGDNFSVVGSLYASNSYNANYSMYEDQRLGFLDKQGGNPTDMYDLDGDGDLVNDWYIVPGQFGAASQYMERDRTGGSVSAVFDVNENWSMRGDFFYTEMDQFNRGVKAGFNGQHTPKSFEVDGVSAERNQEIYDAIQPGSKVGFGSTISFVDADGETQTRNLNTLHVVDVWAADFQTTSSNEISKTAAYNSNFEVAYTNNDNFEANFRVIHAKAEKQYRKADFQQGTPAWLWVDNNGVSGKDPVDGFHVSVDYTGDYPSFAWDGDLSDPSVLKQYQGFAEGANTDAELSAARVDVTFSFDHNHFASVDAGVRYGVREANHNKFNYVTPTGRYTNWEDPRVPADKRYKLLPGNLIWQKFPDWLTFDYSENNVSLIDIGGLQDNGFSGADTVAFYDFGPIKGFEGGVAALAPDAWDNPYEFMNRLYPGTRTVNDPGYTYRVQEDSINAYVQFNFANDDEGLFGIPYNANIGLQVAQTDREIDKSVVPEVLDSFNSIGYDDWQKIAYVYEVERYTNSKTELLPSFNLNLFPLDDVIIRLAASRTMTRNDLENVGASMSLWYAQCPKTDENGEAVMVPNPSTGSPVQDTVGCIGGGNDYGNPDIEPWMANVYNLTTEWYFDDDAILGAGLFMIDVDQAVQSFQEQRNFLDMDGIDRGRVANVWTTRNVGASDLYGVELGYKQPFTFFENNIINKFGVEFNYTYSHSESEDIDVEGNVLPLPFNSEHQTNAILWYDHAGLNVRLAYNWRSEEYLGMVGVNSNAAVLNLGQWLESAGYLDLSISYWLNDNVSFFVNGTNLTEQSRKSYAQYEDQFHSLWVQETRYSAGVNLSF